MASGTVLTKTLGNEALVKLWELKVSTTQGKALHLVAVASLNKLQAFLCECVRVYIYIPIRACSANSRIHIIR